MRRGLRPYDSSKEEAALLPTQNVFAERGLRKNVTNAGLLIFGPDTHEKVTEGSVCSFNSAIGFVIVSSNRNELCRDTTAHGR